MLKSSYSIVSQLFLILFEYLCQKDKMLLNQFDKRFPTEESCEDYFLQVRKQEGVVCPRCKNTTRTWMESKQGFQCPKCGCRIPLTQGTVMEHSKLPMRIWFYTMHLMTSIKQVLSAKEVQHQLAYPEYPPVWLMMMKLRSIMGKREEMYQLTEEVEVDEAFFPIRTGELDEDLKRGAGSQKQMKVLVIVESKPVDKVLMDYLTDTSGNSLGKSIILAKRIPKNGIQKIVHYIKMYAIDNLSAETIDKLMQNSVVKDAIIVTDGSSSHVNFKDYFKGHMIHIEKADIDKVVKSKLPWVHVIIGRCRDGIAAIHREVDGQFLQLYLNEFCWKFNRRFFRDSTEPKYDLFDRLVRIAACYTSDIKWRNYNIPPDDEEN